MRQILVEVARHRAATTRTSPDSAPRAPPRSAPHQPPPAVSSSRHRLTTRIETFPKPVIVAVNGLAHGAGSEITEAAALAIASERAEFCKAEISLDFSPPWGGSQRLPGHVGRKRALYMILTADRVPAKTAEASGLVNFVVPHETLLDRPFALAGKIVEKSPLAVAAGLGRPVEVSTATIDLPRR